VVEDDALLRGSLRELLEEEGFLVDTAGDGSGRGSGGRREPDAVLMDLRMPGFDGAEAMLEVKPHAPSAEIIVFSTYNDPASKKLLEDQGAFRYLVKGVSTEAIVEAVTQDLDHKRRSGADAGRALVNWSAARKTPFSPTSAETLALSLVSGESCSA